ncbi:hypothetical protein Drose_36745 [Dactylosporangium roseum]|uniref:Flavin reductase n=1 Tax=Dactylosporangium roseum TaxID=47989 RepID=A0ABY5Z3A1_9ACTN|nr:hypothetical protein [Dactylosporangium roseum]UWZ36504.1 hypothetical protein Drose_36745 [Dactylosporangium roseum]
MRKQAPPRSDAASAGLIGLGFPSVAARTERHYSGLVLVVTDDVHRLHLMSGNDGPTVEAVRGALRLAAGASAHARQLAAALGQPDDRHAPARPEWVCVRCGRPWPCGSVRRHLADEFANNLGALTVLMAARVAEASEDLGVAALPELYDRFLGWTPEPTTNSTCAEER